MKTLWLISRQNSDFSEKVSVRQDPNFIFSPLLHFSLGTLAEIPGIKRQPLGFPATGANRADRGGLTSLRFCRSHCECQLRLSNTVRDLMYYLIDKKYSIGDKTMKTTSTGNILLRGSCMGMYQGQKIELQVKKLKYSSSYITKFYLFFLVLFLMKCRRG